MESSETSYCAVYLIKDSSPTIEPSDQSNGFEDCSVRVLHSNIPGHMEPLLRPYMVNKISTGNCVPGISSVFAHQFKEGISTIDDLGVYAMAYRHENHSLVTIVMLHERDILLAFQKEIDAFCAKKYQMMVNDDSLVVSESCGDELNRWFYPCVLFLPRAVKVLGHSLQHFLYASLCDMEIVFCEQADASWSQIHSDVTRFADLTRLTLHFGEEEGEKTDQKQCTLQFDAATKEFNCSCTESTVFSCDWAQVIQKMVGVASPAAVRDLVHNFKHRALKDLNTFVRMVHLAENDHYALFKCVDYARSTNNEKLLITLAESHYTGLAKSTESLKVLKVLREHILGKEEEKLIDL